MNSTKEVLLTETKDALDKLNGEGASAPTPPTKSSDLWRCGHPRNLHTREEAAACWNQQQRTVPRAIAEPSPPPLTAADICAEAAKLVGGDRAVSHGDKALNFSNTASLWNALLDIKRRTVPLPITLTTLDIANMLELAKIARRYSGTHNIDDYIDGAGYAGCAGEIAGRASTSSNS